MVIGEITVEGPLEMALVEGNDMIQAFPTDATDNALGIRVLPSDIVVSLFQSGEIFRIDPTTNNAERVSSGLPLQSPVSVAFEADGS